MTYRLSELPVLNSVEQAMEKADRAYARWMERGGPEGHHRELHQHHTTQQLQTLVGAVRRLVVVLESEGLEGPEISAVREALKKLGEPEG